MTGHRFGKKISRSVFSHRFGQNLAMRLFLRYSDEADPFSASALEKLAGAMPEPVRAQVQATAAALGRRLLDPAFSQHLMTITDAWTRRRVLHLGYRSAGKTRTKDVVVEPYFLEPSAADELLRTALS